MHELTLTLPDDLYLKLQAQAARKGLPLEGFIVDKLTIETLHAEPERQEQHVLEEALAATGLVQAVSPDLITMYVTDPTTPRQSPVRVQGKSLSTIIIEQRERTE